MDLNELGFTKVWPAKTGRPGYEPKDLLKCYITSSSKKKGFMVKRNLRTMQRLTVIPVLPERNWPIGLKGMKSVEISEGAYFITLETHVKLAKKKPLCTTSKDPRRITRCPEENAIDRMATRMKPHPEIMKKRKQILEHPFGTIKFWNHQSAFLMKGFEKVRAEFSLSTLAYNMKRGINIVGLER